MVFQGLIPISTCFYKAESLLLIRTVRDFLAFLTLHVKNKKQKPVVYAKTS